MKKVILAYAVEDTSVADMIVSKMEESKISLEVELYPIVGSDFWDGLYEGTIDSKQIMIICSETFANKHRYSFNKCVLSNKTDKYNFILIIFDENSDKIPVGGNRHERVEFPNISILHFKQNEENSCTEIIDYLKAVQTVSQNQTFAKKQKRWNKQKKLGIVSSIYILMGIVLLIIGAVCILFIIKDNTSSKDRSAYIGFVMLGMELLVLGIFSKIIARKKRSEQEETLQFKKDLDMLSKSKLVTKKIDDDWTMSNEEYQPLEHLKINWKQMKGYYDISKKQANRSFGWAVAFSVGGFLIMAFTVVSPLIPGFQNDNSLIPVIGTISGAVVELIAATILFVYKRSLSQMNFYHDALSHYQNYLSCVNLVSKMSSAEKQDEMLVKIIEHELEYMPKSDESKNEK